MSVNILDSELKKASNEGVDAFLSVFINKYLEVIGDDLGPHNMDKLNGHQHSLLAFHFFSTEIRDGGFVQLIQNGYGGYVFDNPFAKAMRLFGADELSKLIYKAKKIYDANRKELEQETTEEEFMAMYEKFEVFDEIEELYIEIEEDQTEKIAVFVDGNLHLFATVV